MTYPQFARQARALLDQTGPWPEVQDHFMLAAYRAELEPWQAASMFAHLISLEKIEE